VKFTTDLSMGLLVGVTLMFAGFWAARQLHIVWNIWPSTDGVVVRGSVEEVLQAPYAKGGMPVHRYMPKVVFRYTVRGREYSTEAPSVYIADTYDEAAADMAGLYRSGSHHPIRYNPSDPRDIEFGVVEFGPLVFSFLLLIGGVVPTTVGVKALVMGYSHRLAVAPAIEEKVQATVLSFSAGALQEPSSATLRCPACGRPVKPTEDTCANCLKFLRAA
jgi:hypothetical protein